MSENPKIFFELKEYLEGMKRELLEDSKQRHENHGKVTETNFDKLVYVSAADRKSMEDHAKSTRWMLMAFIAILALVMAYLEVNGKTAREQPNAVTREISQTSDE